MKENYYDIEFEKIRKEKFEILKKKYIEFENNYKNKIIAIEDFMEKAKKDELSLTEFLINNTLYFDNFKKDIEGKMNYAFERYKNPISYMIKNYLPNILTKYTKQKEYNIAKNQETRFNYDFFDNFKQEDAVELYANIQAFEDLKKYLYNIIDKTHGIVNEREKKQSFGSTNFTNDNIKSIRPIVLKYKNIDDVKKELYAKLDFFKLINIEENDFMLHFETNEDNYYEKIIWYGDDVEILYLFNLLRISDKTPYKIITTHFLNRYKKPFNINSLRQSLNKLKKKKEKERTLYEKKIRFGDKQRLYENIEEICEKINNFL